MTGLLPLLNLISQWVWLGRHIVSVKPYTARVFCYDICADGAFFQAFSTNEVPWSSYGDAVEYPPVLDGNTVNVILTNELKTVWGVIPRAASTASAFRARYFLVASYGDKDIRDHTVGIACAHGLTQTVVIRLEDKAIFAVSSMCPQLQVIPVSTVLWPDLRSNMNNCTLRLGIESMFPETAQKEKLLRDGPAVYDYVKAGLKCHLSFVPITHENVTEALLSGEIDVAFVGTPIKANTPADVTFTVATQFVWCVPETYVLADVSYLLWREFTGTTWILLTASFIAVWLSVWWFSPRNTSTLCEIFFTTLSLLAAVAVKSPSGHTRWTIGGWLLAMLVLNTAYQTALHSMMAAPLFVHEIEDIYQLKQTQLPLFCDPLAWATLQEIAEGSPIVAELAARTEEMNPYLPPPDVIKYNRHRAEYVSDFACYRFNGTWRALNSGRSSPILAGFVQTALFSSAATKIRQLHLQAAATGLTDFWFRVDVKKSSISDSKTSDLQPITITLLIPAVLLLCAGWAFAFLVFLTELWWSHHKTKTKTNHTKANPNVPLGYFRKRVPVV